MNGAKSARLALGAPAGMALLFLALISLPEEASSQRRSRDGNPGQGTAADSPTQGTLVPLSALNLGSLPFRIVYESFVETAGEANWEIIIVNADGTGMRNLTNTPSVEEHYPHTSPDGTKILFVAVEGETRRDRSRNVYYMNLDGTGRTKVAENAYQPTWSGDGKSIAYLKGEYDRYSRTMTSNKGLTIFDLDTGTSRDHPERELGMLHNLTWSPDNEWFIATSRGGGRGNILVDATGSGIRSLSIRGCRPDLSPDGKQIAWGRTDQDLWIGSFDPSVEGENVVGQRSIVAVTRRHKVYHVDWSPNGRYLALSYGPSRGGQAVGQLAAGWNIAVLEVDSGKWAQITTDGNHNKEPDWVPTR